MNVLDVLDNYCDDIIGCINKKIPDNYSLNNFPLELLQLMLEYNKYTIGIVSSDNKIIFNDIRNNSEICTVKTKLNYIGWASCYSLNSKMFVCGNDKTITIYDIDNINLIDEFNNNAKIYNTTNYKEGRYLINFKSFNIQNKKQHYRCMAISNDGTKIMYCNNKIDFTIYDSKNKYDNMIYGINYISCACFSFDNSILFIGTNTRFGGSILAWDWKNDSFLGSYKDSLSINYITISSRGNKIIYLINYQYCIIDVNSFSLLSRTELNFKPIKVVCSPDDKYIAVFSYNQYAIYDEYGIKLYCHNIGYFMDIRDIFWSSCVYSNDAKKIINNLSPEQKKYFGIQ